MAAKCNRIELSQNLAVMTGIDGKELSSYLVYNQDNYVYLVPRTEVSWSLYIEQFGPERNHRARV